MIANCKNLNNRKNNNRIRRNKHKIRNNKSVVKIWEIPKMQVIQNRKWNPTKIVFLIKLSKSNINKINNNYKKHRRRLKKDNQSSFKVYISSSN